MTVKKSINFIKKLNRAKIINILKVYFSFIFSSLTKTPIRFGMPISMSIEPSAFCNLQCPQCPVGTGKLNRKQGNIDVFLYKKIIDQSAKYLTNLFLYFQGEPFLNKNIFDLIKYASQKNIYTATSTNGHFFTNDNILEIIKSGLDTLIISLDGTNQQTYEKYRIGGNFDTVVEGIKNLLKTRDLLKTNKPFIELQFLVLKSNEHQIEEIKKIAKNLGVDTLSIKTAQVYNFENDKDFIPIQHQKFSRYKKVGDKWILKKKLKNRCWRLWNSVVITWDGLVLPCCFDKDAKYAFGNIKNADLKKIIKNNKFKIFAKKLLTSRKEIDICQNCSE
jgi:radical SAM protein with 4Fe4S-binding SPASM domain